MAYNCITSQLKFPKPGRGINLQKFFPSLLAIVGFSLLLIVVLFVRVNIKSTLQ